MALYNFPIVCNPITTTNIVNIHEYLMKKHNGNEAHIS